MDTHVAGLRLQRLADRAPSDSFPELPNSNPQGSQLWSRRGKVANPGRIHAEMNLISILADVPILAVDV